MEERRKFNRWYLEEKEKAVISLADTENKEEVEVVDISAGGMRFFSSRPVEIGTTVYGEFKVLPNLGPYFIKGRVNRVEKRKEDAWEIAIQFEKVRTIPEAM